MGEALERTWPWKESPLSETSPYLPCEQFKQDGTQTPPVTGSGLLTYASNFYVKKNEKRENVYVTQITFLLLHRLLFRGTKLIHEDRQIITDLDCILGRTFKSPLKKSHSPDRSEIGFAPNISYLPLMSRQASFPTPNTTNF